MRAAKLRRRRYVTCSANGEPHRVKCIYTERQHTFYPDDASNFFTGCAACHAENNALIEEMWKEYYYSQGL